MIEEHAKTLAEAFATATSIIARFPTTPGSKPYRWFRGVKDKNLLLVPGAYWRTNYDEHGALVAFSQDGGAYANVGQMNDWETYYLAQHVGIPTRLLDWTESFSAALFFALDRWEGASEPCVWILDPCALNKLSIDWNGIIAPNNFPDELGIWLPKVVAKPAPSSISSDGFTYDNRKPLAIYPRRANARIVAQQGSFTVHGQDKGCLRSFIDSAARLVNSDPAPMLARIVISGARVEELKDELELLGVRRWTIYPDMQNFVLHLQSVYRW